ncbi:response regulator [Crocosphaera sp.]|uniref:response regulator n=1 Tax=Crocosphaera sp. TaxID=2729996 RepID=UPI00262989EB|nr:response regulator [Crocosphaera sp.]MDJ0580548.1 response regulator [Crocosphaera sp.]
MSKVETLSTKTKIGLKEFLLQLQKLTKTKFSGCIEIQVNNHENWTLFLRLGRLSWSDGGTNSGERWRRNLQLFVPKLNATELKNIASLEDSNQRCNTLVQLLDQGLIQRQQLTEFILTFSSEILFDVIQSSQINRNSLSYEIIRDDLTNKSALLLPMVEVIPTLKQTLKTWQQWQNQGLGIYSPNLFPIITQPELISNQIFSGNQSSIIALIDGMHSLRSLAIKTRLDIVPLIQFLLPLAKQQAIKFSQVSRNQKSSIFPPGQDQSKKNLIACVDDSAGVCRGLKKIIDAQGYDFVGIQDPLKALPSFLKNKPDLIFLDLVMPITNGYELCTQLRKTPSLTTTPVVILTGKEGLVDRMRAKMVGANDFLSKPVKVSELIKVLNKNLSQSIQDKSK